MGSFTGTQRERDTRRIATSLKAGGEPLRAGLRDAGATLDRAGFEVIDDEVVELLSPRYGLPLSARVYPARILTATRRRSVYSGSIS